MEARLGGYDADKPCDENEEQGIVKRFNIAVRNWSIDGEHDFLSFIKDKSTCDVRNIMWHLMGQDQPIALCLEEVDGDESDLKCLEQFVENTEKHSW